VQLDQTSHPQQLLSHLGLELGRVAAVSQQQLRAFVLACDHLDDFLDGVFVDVRAEIEVQLHFSEFADLCAQIQKIAKSHPLIAGYIKLQIFQSSAEGQIAKHFLRKVDAEYTSGYSERFKVRWVRLGNLLIPFRTEYIPFWLMLLNVEMVSSRVCKWVISAKDSPSLKKEPPPIPSVLNHIHHTQVF